MFKADGLAAGKELLILESLEDAKSELEEMLSNEVWICICYGCH